jgi:hydrogenase nickel incorporation protein HypB
MCTTCGCGHGETRVEGQALHGHEHGHDHGHGHGHDHHHHHHPYAPKHTHAAGMAPSRMLKIEQDILAKNDGYARENRAFLTGRRVFALNLVSSPGSGKTTLLCKTIELLKGKWPVAVIEGDQQTSNDC